MAVAARSGEKLDDLVREHPGAEILPITADVTSDEDRRRILDTVTKRLGGLDVLVNNASSLGPAPLKLLADTDCEELELALATNLVGPFRLTKALVGALAASARERRLRPSNCQLSIIAVG